MALRPLPSGDPAPRQPVAAAPSGSSRPDHAALNPSSPDALRLRALQGDRRAQADLLHHFQDLWFRYCLSQLADPDLARDATQETALRFLQNLHTFSSSSTLQTWSIGIALNVCRETRRKHRHLFLSDETAASLEDSDFPSPLRLAADAESIDRLRAILAQLPPRQREAVTLRYFENLSLDQTASAMQCATGTIKATLNQALRNLRRLWSPEANPDKSSDEP